MNESQKELAVCNLSCYYLEEFRADTGERMMQAVRGITRFSWGLSEDEVRGAREWARSIRDMELANRAKRDAAAH